MSGNERSGGRNAAIARALTRDGIEVDSWPWLRRRSTSRRWTRERIRRHLAAWLAGLGAVETEAARDAVGALADLHFLLQIVAERIAECPADPRPIGKRDTYAVQSDTHTRITRTYRALGLWPMPRPKPRAAAPKPSKVLQFERPRGGPAA